MSLNLNYHHLRYFREVARLGHMGRAADMLNVAQSALSVQIRQLEERLGHPLFIRHPKGLELSEAGRIALDHADRIFSAGDELLATLEQSSDAIPPLRIGALSTLSRNFQLQFLEPLLKDNRYGFTLQSGQTGRLLDGLEALDLDIVLSTQVPERDRFPHVAAQRIAEQPVFLQAIPSRLAYKSLADILRNEPIILPTESVISAGFEDLVARLGISPKIAATVDDMAMVRLLARTGIGVAVAPSVVVADEIASGLLQTAPFDLGIAEPFFAVTLPRKFPHPAVVELLGQAS